MILMSSCDSNECMEIVTEYLDPMYNGYKGTITPNQACHEIEHCSNNSYGSISDENDHHEEIVDAEYEFETK